MKARKSIGQLLAEGRQLEGDGQLEDAAAAYQRIVDTDPRNQPAVERLLVVYRRLKDYRKELAVIDAALGAVQKREKSTRQKWIEAHPGAAKLGKAVLRTLGGENVSGYGTDPLVEKLVKRRAFVEKRIGGKKAGHAPKKKKPAVRKAAKPSHLRVIKGGTQKSRKEEVARRKKERAEQVRREKEKKAEEARRAREEKAEQLKKEKEERAGQKRREKEEKAERARKEKEARALEKQQAKEAKAQPSLFVISLRYQVSLEKIDAAMAKHVAFLDKHFAAGDFLVSGRQVPRTGGIIIARGKSLAAVERMMRQDPFIKGKLANFDIVEFVPGYNRNFTPPFTTRPSRGA